MNKATVTTPKTRSSLATNEVSDQGYTYNEAGFSYNQAGVTYGGAVRTSSPAPTNSKANVQ